MEKKTLIVNLFGGPGAGKSTGATYIFSKLKLAGVDAEYVSEYAKDKVWEQQSDTFWKTQMYVTGKQAWKIARCFGKVDVIITDSPIRLGRTYAEAINRPKLAEAITEEANIYNDSSIDIFVNRVKPYNPNGRNQTADESDKIAETMKAGLRGQGVNLIEINGDEAGYTRMVEYILNILDTNNDKNE